MKTKVVIKLLCLCYQCQIRYTCALKHRVSKCYRGLFLAVCSQPKDAQKPVNSRQTLCCTCNLHRLHLLSLPAAYRWFYQVGLLAACKSSSGGFGLLHLKQTVGALVCWLIFCRGHLRLWPIYAWLRQIPPNSRLFGSGYTLAILSGCLYF